MNPSPSSPPSLPFPPPARQVVANSRNSEAFVALCLLTVAGASLITQRMGFSDTMGAFTAGVLLSETNYKTQVGRGEGWRREGGVDRGGGGDKLASAPTYLMEAGASARGRAVGVGKSYTKDPRPWTLDPRP